MVNLYVCTILYLTDDNPGQKRHSTCKKRSMEMDAGMYFIALCHDFQLLVLKNSTGYDVFHSENSFRDHRNPILWTKYLVH